MIQSSQPLSKPLEVLWDAHQVAKYFGVQKSTIWKWIKAGKIIDPTTVVRLGRHILIPRSEIERIVEKKKEQLKS